MENKIPVFKCRASQAGLLLTNAKGAITEKQLEELDKLSKKSPITDKQLIKLNELIHKRDNPQLSATAKSMVKSWLQAKLYNRHIEFTSKYTDKGIVVEVGSIDFAAKELNLGIVFKNEEYKENDYFTGTCDVQLKDEILEHKNSFDFSTFPLFDSEPPDPNNKTQVQVYMNLYNKKKARIIYTLSNTPEDIIERELSSYMYHNHLEEVPKDIFDKIVHNHTYDDVEVKYKLKVFPVEYDAAIITELKKRVLMARNYVNELVKSIK